MGWAHSACLMFTNKCPLLATLPLGLAGKATP